MILGPTRLLALLALVGEHVDGWAGGDTWSPAQCLAWVAHQEHQGNRWTQTELAEASGWSRKQVRRLLAGKPPAAEGAQGVHRGQTLAPLNGEKAGSKGVGTPDFGPTRGHVYVRESSTDKDIQGGGAGGGHRARFDRLVAVAQEVGLCTRKLHPSRGQGKLVAARLADHTDEELERLMRWWKHSPHPRAKYLRDNGYGLGTLLRPSKVEEYLHLSAQKLEGATALRAGTTQQQPTTLEAMFASWDEAPAGEA